MDCIRIELVAGYYSGGWGLDEAVAYLPDVLQGALDDVGCNLIAAMAGYTTSPELSLSVESRVATLEEEKATSYAAGYEAGQAAVAEAVAEERERALAAIGDTIAYWHKKPDIWMKPSALIRVLALVQKHICDRARASGGNGGE